MKNTDVIILGNGLIAKTLALGLSKIGLQSKRVAQCFPEYKNDPRSYAIAPSSMRLLEALGLKFDDGSFTQVSSVELGFGDQLRSPLFPISRDEYMFFMVDHSVLDYALDQNLANGSIDALPGKFDQGEYKIELPEIELAAPLLLVAEGKYGASLSRLGFNFERYDYHQHAITSKFKTERPHNGVARQLFETTGPLGLLPYGTHGISIVWSQNQSIADALTALSDDEFRMLINDKIGEFYGEIELVGARSSFPLKQSIATRLIQNRVALLGDSAHAIHPIAGQGLNLGLRDVACMIETLRQSKTLGLDIGAENTLTNYAQWRHDDITKIAQFTRGINKLTQSSNPIYSLARGATQSVMKSQSVRDKLAHMSDAPLSPQPPLLDGKLYELQA